MGYLVSFIMPIALGVIYGIMSLELSPVIQSSSGPLVMSEGRGK